MAIFSLIDSPCPYKGKLTEILDGDTCRLCQRQVRDLTDMSDKDKRVFLKSCRGEVCVSYSVAAGTIAALTVLATAAIGAPPAMAQPTDPTDQQFLVFVGGIKDGSNALFVEDESDAAIPELPVVCEPTPRSDTTTDAVPEPATKADKLTAE